MMLEFNHKQSLMLVKNGAFCSVNLLSSKALYPHFPRQDNTSGSNKRGTMSASNGRKGVVLLSFKSNRRTTGMVGGLTGRRFRIARIRTIARTI
jgi:hypothetical protein